MSLSLLQITNDVGAFLATTLDCSLELVEEDDDGRLVIAFSMYSLSSNNLIISSIRFSSLMPLVGRANGGEAPLLT